MFESGRTGTTSTGWMCGLLKNKHHQETLRSLGTFSCLKTVLCVNLSVIFLCQLPVVVGDWFQSILKGLLNGSDLDSITMKATPVNVREIT